MADNINPIDGTVTPLAADDISNVKYPRVKIVQGADGSATDVSSTDPLPVYQASSTTGGSTIYRVLATGTSQDAANIKASAGQVYGWYISNINASPMFVKLYNKVTTPSNADTPAMTLVIPGNTAGAGCNVAFPQGIAFGTGIGIRIVTTVADNGNTGVTANDVIVNLFYK